MGGMVIHVCQGVVGLWESGEGIGPHSVSGEGIRLLSEKGSSKGMFFDKVGGGMGTDDSKTLGIILERGYFLFKRSGRELIKRGGE
jgi:hypothetical protein